MKKLVGSLLMAVLCLNIAYGQIASGSLGYYNDALLFGRTYQAGTARMQAIGGAQVSLGGDMSMANSNPAGLGFFNKSAFSFTPSLDFHTAEATYLGQITDDFKANANFANLGIVFNMNNTDDESRFKGGSFAITLTRTNDFFNDVRYDADNNDHSIIDAYLDRALELEPNQLGEDLFFAYEHYLINPYTATDSEGDYTAYDSPVADPRRPRQVESIQTTGRQYEWNFSYGANYDDILYFGGGLGISTVDYEKKTTFTESEFDDGIIDELSTQNILDINGIGVNGNLGIIIRPIDAVRFGLSAKTPTFYNLKDDNSNDLSTIYNDYYYEDEDVTLNEFYNDSSSFSQYTLRTPWRLSAGASVFIGKRGFISADIDYVDYSNSRIKSDDFSATADNRSIKNIYGSTFNYRMGAEFRLDVFRLRAGYNYQGDPYVESNIDNSIHKISGGAGYRNRNMYVDLSVVHTKFDSQRTPYTFYDGSGPTADIVNKNVNVSATVGFNF